MPREIKIMSNANEHETEPVPVSVQNAKERHTMNIPRDKWIKVPDMVYEVLKNAVAEVTEPDLAYHERNPHSQGELPRTITKKVKRFMVETR